MTYAYIVGLFLGLAIGLIIGKEIGKQSRKIDLAGLGASEAFAYFATKECARHQEDQDRIHKELDFLRKQGIVAPDIPLNVWVEVKNFKGDVWF